MLRSLFIVALTLIGVAFAVMERVRWLGNDAPAGDLSVQENASAPPNRRKGASGPSRDDPVNTQAPTAETDAVSLIVPVEGILRVQLIDTWGQARSEGRAHQGIDILAPEGAAVRAAVDGRIVKFYESDRGGITIYQYDSSERFVYYYAHLSARARNLVEGQEVRQGDVIGAVGMTGNATVPHLHFEVQRLAPGQRWWVADAINPYPLLISGRAPT